MSDTFTAFPPLVFDANAIDRQGWGMANSGPTDDKLIVGFYRKSVLNGAKSREAGKPVYESRDYVKIQHPGETLNVVDRPAHDGDRQRWPQKWDQYQRGVHQIPDGVPLNQLFPDKPHIVDMMRGYNIHTVEQLENLSGDAISTVGMGCQEWVNAAKRYMERVNKGVNHHQFEKALADRDQEIRTLKRQLDDVTTLIRSQQQRAAPQSPNVNFDAQTSQINAIHQSNEPFTPEPARFVQDLSGDVQPKRRPGRPRKIQEH